MYRLFFQKLKQSKLNIEKWVILSSSLPPTGLSPPCQMPYVSPMQWDEKPIVQGVQKKNVHTGLDREQPFSSPFLLPILLLSFLLLSVMCAHRKTDPVFPVCPTQTAKSRYNKTLGTGYRTMKSKWFSKPLSLDYCRRLYSNSVKAGATGTHWGGGSSC